MRPANYWRNRLAVLASGLTAYACAGYVAHHDGGAIPGTGPDDFPTVFFIVAWPTIYGVYAWLRDLVYDDVTTGDHDDRQNESVN